MSWCENMEPPWRAPIASLLARHNCTGVYLDFGTNIGVQIRKLFEPHKFEGAHVLPLFSEVFGAERCRTCAIGIEPNPRHARRLDQLESRLGAVGAGVLVLRGAATTSEGSVQLALPAMGTREGIDLDAALGSVAAATRVPGRGKLTGGTVAVPAYDLAAIFRFVHGQLPPPQRLLVKMDVEGCVALGGGNVTRRPTA